MFQPKEFIPTGHLITFCRETPDAGEERYIFGGRQWYAIDIADPAKCVRNRGQRTVEDSVLADPTTLRSHNRQRYALMNLLDEQFASGTLIKEQQPITITIWNDLPHP